MGAPEATAFLNHLASVRKVAASTQNQALCALVFLYRHVLGMEMPELEGLERAKRPENLPTVMTREEVQLVIDQLEDPCRH
jgi:site-specific recombinase XerD